VKSSGTVIVRRALELDDHSRVPPERRVMFVNELNRIHRIGARRCRSLTATLVLPTLVLPSVAAAQASPFLTGATALQNNILAWLTPIAVILIMVLGAMAMANRMSWGWCIGAILGIAIAFGAPQIIIENCSNTLILRCSGSEQGGTSQFASRLIGEREVIRRQTSRGRDRDGLFTSGGTRRSLQINEQQVIESAVLASELEQLPDLSGYLKTASSLGWVRVGLRPPARR
jgi:type IV secretion system protein VirB2